MLTDLAERHFFRLLPLPDDHGCCELTPDVVKGRCYPLKPKVTTKMIDEWNQELQKFDVIRMWEEKGRKFGYFPTWAEHQRIRSLNKRRTPEPPSTVVNCRQVTTTVADCGSLPSSLSSLPSSLSFLKETTLSGKPPDALPTGLINPLGPGVEVLSGGGPGVGVLPGQNLPKRDYREEAKELIGFLNQKTGRNYEPVDANMDLIVARLRDGATMQECRSVIAKKCREWQADEKMAIYLRPATLFNRMKFAQYKGELYREEKHAKVS